MSTISRSIAEANELDKVDPGILAANGIEIENDAVLADEAETRGFLSRIPVLRGLAGDRVPDVPALIGGVIIALAVLYGLLAFVSVGENILDRRVSSGQIGLLVVFFIAVAVVIFFAASSGVQRYLDERKAKKSGSE